MSFISSIYLCDNNFQSIFYSSSPALVPRSSLGICCQDCLSILGVAKMLNPFPHCFTFFLLVKHGLVCSRVPISLKLIDFSRFLVFLGKNKLSFFLITFIFKLKYNYNTFLLSYFPPNPSSDPYLLLLKCMASISYDPQPPFSLLHLFINT